MTNSGGGGNLEGGGGGTRTNSRLRIKGLGKRWKGRGWREGA